MTDLTRSDKTTPLDDGIGLAFYKDGSNKHYQPSVMVGKDGTEAHVDAQNRLLTAPSGDLGFAQGVVTGATTVTYSAGEQIGAPVSLTNVLFVAGSAHVARAVTVTVGDGTKLLDNPVLAILALDIGTTDATTFDVPFAASGALSLWLPLTKTADLASVTMWNATLPAGGQPVGGLGTGVVAVLVSATTGALPSSSPDIAVQMATVRI